MWPWEQAPLQPDSTRFYICIPEADKCMLLHCRMGTFRAQCIM